MVPAAKQETTEDVHFNGKRHLLLITALGADIIANYSLSDIAMSSSIGEMNISPEVSCHISCSNCSHPQIHELIF